MRSLRGSGARRLRSEGVAMATTNSNPPEGPLPSPDDPAVTDAMIEAGRPYLDGYDPDRHSIWFVLPALFRAMERVRNEEKKA